ncbi:MAG: hypothetical protein A2745_01580 [Candidatus Harrisonbacteria bacterium RIFCSPHIGHO2_01_FULL_44_13]|uniref:SHS2 domain-containing protein n=1 Tax=Candidatus Harrisonbacteria bacterium RIFCSPLOWO2_01_FULL_44_18 TaxID=1798407 RepID=A0A1G1ZMV4_9BACT|nr:MAG: hypothetical protein A2745_01580 [Candidatus Harrisonbacteria bacterium RIFCSPHIGHO2_01_FULL_44_13]OGY65167.1 MAG: hypothetical protein A3A16_00540 [Candidatus Harrisonbacteria bacterium RIFCSPLOWO2_01_FULL_44_18]
MAFDFFKSLLGAQNYLAVDIGTTSIKVLEFSKKSNGRPALRNYGFLETYGYLERFNEALQTSSLKMLDVEAAKYLKIVLDRAGIKSRSAVASIPAFMAFTTLIELPMMSEAETSQTMDFQAKQYIPIPVKAAAIDWIKIGEREDEEGRKRQQVFLISVPKEQIEKYQKIFRLAGLKLAALEIEGLSLARALSRGIKEPVLIVDIGARSTSLTVGVDGLLRFAGQTDFAGGSLTQAVASGLGIAARRAEELKWRKGLIATGGEQELSTLMLPFLDVIINEAKRVKQNYETSYQNKIAAVILAGGGANLLGIEKYFGQQIELPASLAAPFKEIDYPPEIASLIKDLGPAFSAAIGLGMKGL